MPVHEASVGKRDPIRRDGLVGWMRDRGTRDRIVVLVAADDE